jgi:hypothetical protein
MALARSGHVQQCWGDVGDVMARQGDEGEREEQWPEVGGSGLLSSLLPSLKAGVWAGETGGRQQDTLGEAGTLWEGHRGGWLLVLVLICTFADFCPPCVRPNVRKKVEFEFLKIPLGAIRV